MVLHLPRSVTVRTYRCPSHPHEVCDVGYEYRTKGELLEEYMRLAPAVGRRSRALDRQCEQLKRREDSLDAVRDVSWLVGTTGRHVEQLRLRQLVETLSRWAPAAWGEIADKVVAYQHQAMRPTYLRPKPEDWQRLVNSVRRELKVTLRHQTDALDAAWAQHREEVERHEERQGRLWEVEELLGDEVLKVDVRW